VKRLSIVLHTHMPYVEGFGTWPFGEEWLWEAIATSYLPLLDLLDEAPGRVTLSLTPVLADQLEAPAALERALAFLREVRPASHALDLADHPEVAPQLERSQAAYAAAADALERRGDLIAAFAPHVSWTSAATHAVLPLLATDAGVRLQVETGVQAFRARFGAWGGGFWLPECAHAPWLDRRLEEAGVHIACVDWSGVGDIRTACRSGAGIVLLPLDRAAVDRVWAPDGYPAHAAYRDSHRLTARAHRAWANDGSPYDEARAREQARADARDFLERLAPDSVVAFDTELLGHFWHEGLEWLRALLEQAPDAGVELVPADERGADAVPAPEVPATSWGAGRDLRTWSAPGAGGVAWTQRAAELAALGADPSPRALRELLALQSSDWAFLIAAGTAGDYPRRRLAGHHAGFAAALAGEHSPALRNLAPQLARWAFVQP
jgi:1,4-alpha-glucan branching enzyme